MTALLFAMPGNEAMAAGLCSAGGWTLGDWEIRRFPDGESHVRFLTPIAGRAVVLVCSLDDPDRKALALYLAASVARELGARQVGLVLPYLAYMRQDCRFHDGEGVTARHFARLLSGMCDWLVTVDPHLHRIGHLDDIYAVPARVVAAAPGIAAWIAAHVALPLLVGPDEESEQWVAGVAATLGSPYIVLQKTRQGDRDVTLRVPDLAAWRDRTPVLVDDIASTARTMIAASAHLRAAGLTAPWCLAVHPLFAGDAYADLLGAGVAGVVTSNTVAHASNRIDMAGPIAAALGALLAGSDLASATGG